MANPEERINFLATFSEDCLNLNVFIPSNAFPGKNLPVFVYVYGGRFTGGYNSMPYARGARNIIKAQTDAVIVVVNYRLGAFGFLPSTHLKKEGSLNAGIWDVAMAFKWVRKYIREFGGDPRNVVAFGLSSGGMILSNLLVADDGKLDLFDVFRRLTTRKLSFNQALPFRY